MTDDSQRAKHFLSSSHERPHFLIVCGHGWSVDHTDCDHRSGCRWVDRLGYLPWFPVFEEWWAAEGVDSESVTTDIVEGDQTTIGLWPGVPDPAHEQRVRDWHAARGEPVQPARETIEIHCPRDGCRRLDLRFNKARLQSVLKAVLSLIVEQPEYSTIYTPSVSNSLIVVDLQGVWVADRHARGA